MRLRSLGCSFIAVFGLLQPQCLAQTRSHQDWFCPTPDGCTLIAMMFGCSRSTEDDLKPTVPRPFEALTEPQQKHLSQVLAVWQEHSKNKNESEYYFSLKRFDTASHAVNHAAAQEAGYLKFSPPNKWLYRIDNLKWFSGFDEAGQPRYVDSRSIRDHSLFYFDGESLKLLDRINRRSVSLPIVETPSIGSDTASRFPFAIDKGELEARYWIRPIANPDGDANVWIELWPRTKADQRKFSHLRVVLDCDSVSPKELTVFLPNWRREMDHCEVYSFNSQP